MEIDEILANILINDFNGIILPERIVLYGQNYQAPKDGGLYIVISTGNPRIIASNKKFDETTLEETRSVTLATPLTIELTSKDRSAYEQKERAVMALTSTYSVQQQEKYSCRFFREGNIIDLTYIEISSSLYRFNINVVAHHMKTTKTTVDYFEYYRANEYKFERK